MIPNDKREQIYDDLIDSLLKSAFETGSESEEQRIADVMNRIESGQIETRSTTTAVDRSRRSRKWQRWMSLAVAAMVLVALFVVLQTNGSSGVAMAAVERSIAAARDFIARQYRVTVTLRSSEDNPVEIDSDLFVQGGDQFALRHPSLLLPGTSFWLGTDGADAWFVPALGPVRIGDETGLGQWLDQREDVSTPYLHVETVLSRMKRGYRLQDKPEVPIELSDGTTVCCQHMVGLLRWNRIEKAPDKIELWADAQSGVAMRRVATRDKPTGPLGREQIEIEFVDSPKPPDDWFAANGHSSPNRSVLQFDSLE